MQAKVEQLYKKDNVSELFSLETGDLTLRYLMVKSRSIWPDERNPEAVTLLFLGVDVMKNTTVSLKNIGRSHFMHSKGSHCMKLTLPFRLSNAVSNPWVYDVKGLMYVAFNSYNYTEQLSLMRYLYPLWSTAGSRILPGDLIVNIDDIVSKDTTKSPSPFDELPTGSRLCTAEKNSEDRGTQTMYVSKADKCVFTKWPCETKCIQTSDDDLIRGKRKKLYIVERDKKCGGVTQDFLDLINKVIKEFLNDSVNDIFFYKVYHLFETFLFLVNDELQFIEATTTGIYPFHLMVEYANIKKSCRTHTTNTVVTHEVLYQDSLLKIFSKWLGLQFRNFRHAITSQIEDFKKRLIHEKRFLPEPVDLLKDNSLFPLCMIDFLSQWLDCSQESTEEKEFQYSKILLVLELMSDNLITGVGHVVYTKMKSLNTM